MKKYIIIVVLPFLLLMSCNSNPEAPFDSKKSEREIRKTLTALLTAIENRNIDGLKSTMSPSGAMEIIQPSTDITYTVDEFVDFHKEWFKDTTWTMETKILNIESGKYVGKRRQRPSIENRIEMGSPILTT